MLFGRFGKVGVDPDWLDRQSATVGDGPVAARIQRGPLRAILSSTGVKTLDAGQKVHEEAELIVAFQGNVFNLRDIRKEVCPQHPDRDELPAPHVLAVAYRRYGEKLFGKLNGSFALAIWDSARQKLFLARDQIGIEPLFYAHSDQGELYFSTSLKTLAEEVGKELDYHTLQRYLLFNYNPMPQTFFKRVLKIPPGHYLLVRNGQAELHRYWALSFRPATRDEDEICRELLRLMREAVHRRVTNGSEQAGAFLSGGMDSSSVVGLMSPVVDGSIHTFSFRCEGKSFDESYYARVISERYGTQHHQVEFPPERITQIERLVSIVDEPFCDIGIEIASFLLGQEVGNNASYVLTGDGGDELFGGHPVYVADKVAHIYDLLPSILKVPLAKGFSLLPDTDQKKSLSVKLKRFSYSCSFPRKLHSNRWRIYYRTDELRALCTPDLFNEFDAGNGFLEIQRLYDDADGPDYLSRSLYGDYYTVVDFYLRRMQSIRCFGVEGRYPMLDVDLVQFAANIPSDLKIKGVSDTKYILRKTMADVLPDEIVFRKDKLGHSVPMKNWMRESPVVQAFLRDVLNRDALRRRGFFRPEFVEKLIAEHVRRTQNHSHRLWALLVLELWLQRHVDAS